MIVNFGPVFQPPDQSMALIDVEYPADIQLASSIFQAIAAAHHILLLIYHIPHIIPIGVKSERRRPSPVELLSLFVLFLIAVQQWWEGTIRWNPLPNISPVWCSWIKKFSSTLYGACKCSMYFLFLERLYVAFDHSALEFSRRMKWSVRIFSITWTFIILTQLMIFVDGEYDAISGVCTIILPTYLAGAAVLSDLVTVIAISVAFCRRLLLLNMKMKANTALESSPPPNPTKTDAKNVAGSNETLRMRTMSSESVSKDCFTYDMMKKTLVLTVVSLLTTPGSIIIGAVFGLVGFWVAIDFIILCWTVILLFAKHNRIYDHLCGHLEVLVTIRCLSFYSCYHCEDYCCCCTHQLDDAMTPDSPSQDSPATPTNGSDVASIENDLWSLRSNSNSAGLSTNRVKVPEKDGNVSDFQIEYANE